MSTSEADVGVTPDARAVIDSVVGLREYGFRGFLSVNRLWESRCDEVPVERGVYVAVRDTLMPPKFLDHSVGGRFRHMDPSVPIDVLQSHWVPGAVVLYLGLARGPGVRSLLHQRVKRYLRFGQGRVVAHYGGRFVWQLRDHRVMLLAWMPTPDEDPAAVEARLQAMFLARHGRLPFANLRLEDTE
jgi:hypothetical protein